MAFDATAQSTVARAVVRFEATGLGRELARYPMLGVEEDCLLRWYMEGLQYGAFSCPDLGAEFNAGVRAIRSRLANFGNYPKKCAWE